MGTTTIARSRGGRFAPVRRSFIIQGEEELGHQRYCRRCATWWPDDEEFWHRWQDRVSDVCRACWVERRKAAAS